MRSNKSVINIYKIKNTKSEVVTQLLYGDTFKKLKKIGSWIRIKNDTDNYKGYIKKKIFASDQKNTHKIYNIRTNLYSNPNTKSKVKKTLIIVTFIIMAWLSSIKKLQELFHVNDELKKSFDDGGLAANYAQYAYIIALMAGSFVIVFLIKALWNRLIPRITNWRKIDYFEAMGIMTIILLLSYI